MFTAMRFEDFTLNLIDQRLLPHQSRWIEARDLATVAEAIENMSVRGAPAIATAAAYALVLDAREANPAHFAAYQERLQTQVKRLLATRPTAVNLKHALQAIETRSLSWPKDLSKQHIVEKLLAYARELEAADLQTCLAIGRHGCGLTPQNDLKVMTHCNTGSLATAGYGTALGVIRALAQEGRLQHVYVDETRPYLQGSRLTAYELEKEGIPFSIQVDSAAAFVLQREKVDMVIVGADRIASNGDTANKIGTYSLAIAAQYHRVPFYVAAPRSTFDPSLADGSSIPIEMRSPLEILEIAGVPLAPKGAQTLNPSFDVTPAELISGFITEFGILHPPFSDSILRLFHQASPKEGQR